MNASVLQNKKILLFEDQPKVIEWVKHMLGRYGALLTSYETPARLSAQELEEFDLAILDIRFSNQDKLTANDSTNGIEHLRYLRTQTQTLPIVMYSVENNEATTQEAYNLGATAFVPKSAKQFPLKDILQLVVTNNTAGLEECKLRQLASHAGSTRPKSSRAEVMLQSDPYRLLFTEVVEGKTIKELTGLAGISPREILFHLEILVSTLRHECCDAATLSLLTDFINQNDDYL